ncbi:hypothetical protein LL50_05440 [Listeria monocytogenes]|nr:hypothetical protein [Listeria monocytogenes]EAD0383100.1 hypothetical protein [Listeria monocytogenes]EAD9128464.1 hypothetical protein [Listeria monocytogenes]EAE9170613.1 hypothetical protein [Listeria monocytogenes]EAF2023443.1 hypothetical protein [Listeria monocytogenes]
MGFKLSDQETVIHYQHDTGAWRLYTNVQKHINKYKDLVKNPRLVKENERIISLEGELPDVIVSLYKKRKIDEETRKSMGERLKTNRGN